MPNDSESKKRMISLEITDDLREKLRVRAFEERLTISALIRKILEETLNNNIDAGE